MNDAAHSHLSDVEARVRALESLLTEKGYVDPAAVDALIDTYETKIGPRNGAKVVAKAWSNTDFAQWLREDANAAVASLNLPGGNQSANISVAENTPEQHNMVVCTLCSCCLLYTSDAADE